MEHSRKNLKSRSAKACFCDKNFVFVLLERGAIRMSRTVGFIGGGRITRILLGGFKKTDAMPQRVIVSDPNTEGLNLLKGQFPEIHTAGSDNTQPASADVVFLAVHLSVVKDVLKEIASHLKPEATLISLVPKCSIVSLSEFLGGFHRIVRMIPNAPTIVNRGYNPIAFSTTFTETEKTEVFEMLRPLGECPEVEEKHLEAYAVLTAMGPTYLWYLLYELQELGESFGLSAQAAQEGIAAMVTGAVRTMCDSGLLSAEVMDLIPVKPLEDEEETIKNIYKSKLETLFLRLFLKH